MILEASLFLVTTLKPREYRVVDVQTTTAFAGKLGNRVQQKLTLENEEGETVAIKLPRSHTRIRGLVRHFQVGDRVLVHGLNGLVAEVRRTSAP